MKKQFFRVKQLADQAIASEAVLDARDDECSHDRFEDTVWEAVSCVGEADQYAHAATAQLGHVCFPGHDGQYPHYGEQNQEPGDITVHVEAKGVLATMRS
ncbi:hypothetical protein FJT64_014924 [Amphibalanus amphitrite]|uniref:Uncharacterized protein n=1 Tax=Amphibalanus amphitrite TaxID=1232801 RepID=A0A6A4XB10_AMPAM|nr:hypothetical protein FJT64_014924 [Amphibalanus amphitrite]